jgi:hypothetical protein
MRAILNKIINILFTIVGSNDRLSHEYMQPISYRVLVVPSVADRIMSINQRCGQAKRCKIKNFQERNAVGALEPERHPPPVALTGL